MNIKSIATGIALAASLLTATSAEAREDGRYIEEGKVAGFHVIVSATPHNSLWDTIIIPLQGFPGVVSVKCGTGDFVFNEHIGRNSARSVAAAWCSN